METKERLYSELRKKNLRITKPRKAIINLLEGNHLTIQEIYTELKKQGFNNLSTVYNNIDFLIENKIVAELFINGKKHYDLTIDEKSHNADSHIHVTCDICESIVEINDNELFDLIKNYPKFKDFEITKMQIVIGGKCKNYEENDCEKNSKCFIENLKNTEN